VSDRLFTSESLPAAGVGVFSLDDALPRSSTLIEASAGTGKTFTLTHLAASFIERDALPISQLLRRRASCETGCGGYSANGRSRPPTPMPAPGCESPPRSSTPPRSTPSTGSVSRC